MASKLLKNYVIDKRFWHFFWYLQNLIYGFLQFIRQIQLRISQMALIKFNQKNY